MNDNLYRIYCAYNGRQGPDGPIDPWFRSYCQENGLDLGKAVQTLRKAVQDGIDKMAAYPTDWASVAVHAGHVDAFASILWAVLEEEARDALESGADDDGLDDPVLDGR